jgi:hypothetical protein
VDENGNLLQSYWQVDKKQTAGLLGTMFEGETIAVVQNSIQSVVPTQNSSASDEESDEEENESKGIDQEDPKKGPAGYEERPQKPTPDYEDTTDPEPKPEAPTPPPTDSTGPEGYI